MEFSFDLISDLHVETWDNFDWAGQATSPYCVVAGDVSQDSKRLTETLKHLGNCYQGVFYIDGNDEHRNNLENLGQSYRDLSRYVDKFKNVVFMQDNVVVINGVAFLAANGWWSFDLDPSIDTQQSIDWFTERYGVSNGVAPVISNLAYNDVGYLKNSVRKLQMHRDVKAIVMVTHTVPAPWLVSHDLELENHYRMNTTGNPHLQIALDEDSENKIKAWCFGHYHRNVDRTMNGIRYVNNCRGRGNTPWSQVAYYPKRITIEF
jgi:UDP-2,3-diacylglucosamine pyrophosphatase LpxH